jgi:hypothetical protein
MTPAKRKPTRVPYRSGGRTLGYVVKTDMIEESNEVGFALFGRWHFSAHLPDGTKVTESNSRELVIRELRKAASRG